MNKSSPAFRKLRALTLLSTCLALLFFLFFDQSKHQPALAAANPFLDDPFDAVGSFGIQLAALAIALSLLRLLRPYPAERLSARAVWLILHSNLVALLSILVTLAADAVAVLRFPRVWVQAPAGWLLVGLLAGLLVLAAVACWMIFDFAGAQPRSMQLFPAGRPWIKAACASLAGLLVLAVYPIAWRQSVFGALVTILVGMGFLFALVSALAGLFFPVAIEQPAALNQPALQAASQDALDDLAAIYHGLRRQSRRACILFDWLERIARMAWLRAVWNWINPRRHALNLALLIAFAMGVFLILAEVVGEGMPESRVVLLVFAIYLSMEGLGILTGFVLLNGYLGIFSLDRN